MSQLMIRMGRGQVGAGRWVWQVDMGRWRRQSLRQDPGPTFSSFSSVV